MNTTKTTIGIRPVRGRGRGALTTVVLLGPLLTVAGLHALTGAGHLTAIDPAIWLTTALLFWSPLPFSVPAVLMDAARDAALSTWRGPARLLRAVALVPYLLLSDKSAVRGPMAASLAGFVTAAAYAAAVL